jgi:hypothetical protein
MAHLVGGAVCEAFGYLGGVRGRKKTAVPIKAVI